MLNRSIFIISLGITFFVTLVLTRWLINYLNSRSVKQRILEIGPSWHKSKEGTPTMGGIAFILASAVAFFVVCFLYHEKLEKTELFSLINTFTFSTLNGLIGVIDDMAKVRKKKNEGLTPRGKLAFQSLAAIVYLFSMSYFVGIETSLYIPYFNVELNIGFAYYVVAFLLLCGVVNAVNLTDGLDGLASTCSLAVGAFISLCGVVIEENTVSSFIGAILIGVPTSFLIFNIHPAKIFMGDTGSLFIGALVVSSAFAMNNPLLVLIFGFPFIFEAVSVMIQVAYFKLTKGKRLFKMAPFHHHLEKCGMNEMKIVSIFGLVSVLFCALALFGLR